jgi:ABC-2 type transport system permease protein
MTAVATQQARPSTGTGGRRAGFGGALRSEFTKICSVRSTYWALALLVVAGLAWSIAFSAGTAAHWSHMSPQSRSGLDAAQNSVIGLVLLGQLVIVVLGALAMTSEYSTQAVRTSLTVLPRRVTWFTAKGAVFAAVASVVTVASAFASFLVGQRLLAGVHAGAGLSQPGVLRAVLASAAFVVLCGLFSYGLGAMIRSTAGTITAVYGFLLLVPQLARALPTPWYNDAVRWLPGGQFDGAITSSGPEPISKYMFSTWGELAVFGGYTLIALLVGAILLQRRDA